MEFTEFVDTVVQVIERDFTGGTPVYVERRADGADLSLAEGTGKLTAVHHLVQIAYAKKDGKIVTPNKSEPVEATVENASKVARFFARGADDNV